MHHRFVSHSSSSARRVDSLRSFKAFFGADLASESRRTWLIIFFVVLALILDVAFPYGHYLLYIAAVIGVIPTAIEAVRSTGEAKISIDTFNTFAVGASLIAGQPRSAAFIDLMLLSAALLDIFTTERANAATEKLLRTKPTKAVREAKNGALEEVKVSELKEGDIVIIKDGDQAAVDGVVIFGEATFNEASLTGESAAVRKQTGDRVASGTLNESGSVKIRATAVGKDSTIERMASLISDAGKNKSDPERLADRFAGIFLPLVAVGGIVAYFVTGNLNMTIALFLVACADDIAVAIPLAVTAAIGQSAKLGVLSKGGERLDMIGRITTLVLDKTGTLTYGTRKVSSFKVADGIKENDFWATVGAAEKFSEQPIGHTLFLEACSRAGGSCTDPESFTPVTGSGILAKANGHAVAVGSRTYLESLKIRLPDDVIVEEGTVTYVAFDKKYAGHIVLADVPRPEAKEALARIHALGVKTVMFTGDAKQIAEHIGQALGIDEVHAELTPEQKLQGLEALIAHGEKVGVVGDGVNDAPALARADVGIAMGGTGMAVTVEAADIVILTDNLARLPDLILLARRTRSVVYGDMAIWVVTNLLGFSLVFLGLIGPVLAAVYNFVTDFFPLMNSARLFVSKKVIH
jgi:Cd2+/Zn2+-exporting ATPase/Cu+-exporting ATPase